MEFLNVLYFSFLFRFFYRNSGVLGLYKGMESKLFQTVLTAALMFLAYEKIVKIIHKLFKAQLAAKVR